MEKQPMSEVIKETIEKVSGIADTKTVMGEPMTLVDGVTIIPVSKVSVGTGLGGGEYGSKATKNKDDATKNVNNNFGGGGGIGVAVIPVAFLVITAEGEAKILNIGENTGYKMGGTITDTINGIDAALDKAPDMIEKVKNIFKKKENDNKEESTENE